MQSILDVLDMSMKTTEFRRMEDLVLPESTTPAQKRTIEKVFARVKEDDLFNKPEEYEVKEIRVSIFEEGSSAIYMTIESGMIGDETTYASLYGRFKRHVQIKARGGIAANDGKRWISGRRAYNVRTA